VGVAGRAANSPPNRPTTAAGAVVAMAGIPRLVLTAGERPGSPLCKISHEAWLQHGRQAETPVYNRRQHKWASCADVRDGSSQGPRLSASVDLLPSWASWHRWCRLYREGRQNLRGPCSPPGPPAFLASEVLAGRCFALLGLLAGRRPYTVRGSVSSCGQLVQSRTERRSGRCQCRSVSREKDRNTDDGQ
jgi:hypothetical protein